MEISDILQAIDKITENKPNLPVFQELDKTYTYLDLKKESEKIANYILEKIGNKNTPILVYGTQNFKMLSAMLACSKSGHSYIPIDEHTPTERLQMIIDVANPEMILYDTHFDEKIKNTNNKSINDIEDSEFRETYPGLSLNDVYYIIFTSGTTGVPKGVQITHRNLLSFVNWENSDLNLNKGERFLLQAPYSFDLSVMSVYPALVSESCLVPLKKDIINDFQKLFEVLPKLEISVWVSTPSFMDICLMQPTFDKEHLKSINHFLFCGEELPHKTAEKLRERFGNDVYIYNTYGPTEATVAISAIDVTGEVLSKYDRLPIGYVKEDTDVVILDEGKVASPMEQGEIVIAGPSVSIGYMNNPKKTKEAFFEYDGKKAYKTGDAGHMDENGLLYYDGRLDFQIKLHGYRMELEDIDHHLNQVTYVKKASVVPKYKDGKVQQLVAYVVPTDDEFSKDYLRTKEIKKQMAETVMDYMIPQKFVYVDSLPLTQNGKVDRKGLINEVNSK